MAFIKKTEFKFKETSLSEFAGALSHPAHIAILKVLSECTTCACGDLVGRMPLVQSTVLQHIRLLKEVGLFPNDVVHRISAESHEERHVAAKSSGTLLRNSKIGCRQL